MMWWDPGEDVTGWGWAAMSISMVLLWGLLILCGVLLVRALTGSSGSQGEPTRPTPEQILAERLAHGEIDEEEYRRRLDTLRTSASGHVPRP